MEQKKEQPRLLSPKILVFIIAVLFASNLFLFSLLVKEQQKTTRYAGLSREDMEKKSEAKTESLPKPIPLENIPSKPVAPEKTPPETDTKAKPVQTAPPPKVAPVQFDRNTLPLALISATPGEYALLCEKDSGTLFLFRYSNKVFSLVKSYPCLTGANHNDKQKPGDEATPEGVFFLQRFIAGKNLPKKYGYGAFVLNYPNLLSKKEGKKGNGIWLHGHENGKYIGKDIVNTKGCIVVDNTYLEEIARYIKPRGTPIVIVGKAQTADMKGLAAISQEINGFMDSWRQSWESINTKRYMNHYADDFISADGMGVAAFRQHKERVNRYKRFIRISIEDQAIVMPSDNGTKIAVVRFVQKYNSDNFKSDTPKIFYLKKSGQKWRITGESIF